MKGVWVPHDVRDELVDYVHRWNERTEIAARQILAWIGLGTSKFHDWKQRYGKVNEHNGRIPRDHWLEPDEKEAIVAFHDQFPLEGYRRLTFMMIDRDIAFASPASVYRVLKAAGRIGLRKPITTTKGKGFHQPRAPHEHWHVDISYLNIGGTFYYLCSVLDGCSRYVVHWEIREQMTEADVEIVLLRAQESVPWATPRIISDNGPQFLAKDFKEFIRLCGMTHVKTSPYYPQSNGKIERWHHSLKSEAIRPKTPLSLPDAQRVVENFVRHYNHVRLHSAIGYVTPFHELQGLGEQIQRDRDRKLHQARERRKQKRAAQIRVNGLQSPMN